MASNDFPEQVPLFDKIVRKAGLVQCKTWVSIEPYPTPNIIQQDLTEILSAVSFVKRIIFGWTNYNKEISAFTKHRSFYNEQAEIVIRFWREHNIDYHIKNGTIT